MRHSSVKTIVAALTISATVLAAVPAVAAGRANQGSRTQTTQDQAPTNDRFAAVRQFIQRAIRRLVTHGDGMTVPIPKNVMPPAEQE